MDAKGQARFAQEMEWAAEESRLRKAALAADPTEGKVPVVPDEDAG